MDFLLGELLFCHPKLVNNYVSGRGCDLHMALLKHAMLSFLVHLGVLASLGREPWLLLLLCFINVETTCVCVYIYIISFFLSILLITDSTKKNRWFVTHRWYSFQINDIHSLIIIFVDRWICFTFVEWCRYTWMNTIIICNLYVMMKTYDCANVNIAMFKV